MAEWSPSGQPVGWSDLVRQYDVKLSYKVTYLMDVVVDMFTSNGRSYRVTLTDTTFLAGVLELAAFLLETGLDGSSVTVVMLTCLNRCHLVLMTLWEHFTVLDRLDGSVEVVLVHLTVNGSGRLFMAVLRDGLIHDSWCDSLVDGGVMLSGLGAEVNILAKFESCVSKRAKKADRRSCNGRRTGLVNLP